MCSVKETPSGRPGRERVIETALGYRPQTPSPIPLASQAALASQAGDGQRTCVQKSLCRFTMSGSFVGKGGAQVKSIDPPARRRAQP